MRKLLAFTCAVLATVTMLTADVWDNQTATDDSFGTTQNELVHGSLQLHDLAVRPGPAVDVDWYRISQKPYASYEVTMDGVSGDVSAPGAHELERIAADGTTVLQSAPSETVALGNSLSLRFFNNTGGPVNNQFVRVRGAACGTTCGADDIYRIRLRETTIRVARFNNSGTQITVLLTQNASALTVNLNMNFWNTAGGLVNTRTVQLAPRALDVFPTPGAAPGASGHLTVSHDGPHGAVNIKSVALEPATGFSFDTPGVYRPY